MSDANISQMNDKQLRDEVQLLRDELAIFKRKYEDMIYNLDNDNFSSTLIREKDGMKTSIEINAEGIKTKVSNADFESAKTQLAGQITSEVSSVRGELSTVKQTASEISSTVTNLSGTVSSLSITTSGISTRVGDIEDGEFNGYTLFEQTRDKFKFTGNVEISGNAVAGGTITGASFQDSGGTSKLTLGYDGESTVGDLNLHRIESSGNETIIFSVCDEFTMVSLRAFGNSFLKSAGTNTYPIGTWDFTGCTLVGIEGGSGGYAVFG